MNLNELPDMSDALRQVYEGKKKPELDPVGKEDGDIDNDGKKNDPNDKYLANRRKAIAKAMKKEEVEEVEEGKEKGLDGKACWKGYKLAGTKKKGGKTVDNCVKEAFYFSEDEIEGLEEIDEMTDEELIDTMMEAIVDLAEDDEDLLEIAEALEGVELLDEEVEQLDELLGGLVGGLMNSGKKGGFMKGATKGIGGLAGKALGNNMMGFSKGGKVKKGVKKESVEEISEALTQVYESDKYYDSAVKSSKEAAKKAGPSRTARMKGAAKEAGKRVKAGAAAGMKMAKPAAKAAVKGAAKGAGYAVGAAQRGGSSLKKSFSAGYKRGKEGAPGKKEAPKGESKPAAKEKKSSDDGTGGKLDALLASTRGTKGSSSGGGSSSASSGGGESEAPKAKKPGLLSRIGSGLKRAVGKTARAVSGGSDKLAKRLGEDYDQIAHLYESGLFTLTEIENVVEGVRDDKTAERKARLEKKRGMKLDDHPEYKKEEVEDVDEMIDPKGAARMDAAKKKKKVDVFAYDRKLQAQGKLKGKKLPPPPTNEEVEQIDEISADLALTASQKADEERRKAALSGDKERASKKAKQASNIFKGVGKRRAKERMKKEEE